MLSNMYTVTKVLYSLFINVQISAIEFFFLNLSFSFVFFRLDVGS